MPDHPQHFPEVVEDLHGGGRIVHGRRERPNCDVDHDADREPRILLDRALDAERDHVRELPLVERARRHLAEGLDTLVADSTKSPTP